MKSSTFETGEFHSHESPALDTLSEQQLIELMIDGEDLIPRHVIEECVRRGEAMREALRPFVGLNADWNSFDHEGYEWLVVHGAFILGLMDDDASGRLLLDLMRRLAEDEEEDLQDSLAGMWPALFANKSDAVLHEAESFAFGATAMHYMRPLAIEVALAAEKRRDAQALEAMLNRVAAWVSDESCGLQDRLLAAAVLLDFPRPSYRALLEQLADSIDGSMLFDRDDVARAYDAGSDAAQWPDINELWRFYDPDEIAARLERWTAEEEEEPLADDDQELPYIRETPKIGRNDPCPCGSGRKYKKCCLGKEVED